jgi:NADH-quinone oxidoreductase subunit E
MIYLIVKMLALLLIAAALGVALGWILRGARDREGIAAREAEAAARVATLRAERDAVDVSLAEARAQIAAAKAAVSAAAAEAAASEAPGQPQTAAKTEDVAADDQVDVEHQRPAPLARPADGGDDLRVINGIGPKLEELLHELGIWRYGQIAALTPAEAAWVDDHLIPICIDQNP